MAKERKEISKNDQWNVEALYPSLEAWEADFQKQAGHGTAPRWPDIARYRGHLQEGPHLLQELLHRVFTLDRHLSKLYTYAHLRHDEDVTSESEKTAYEKVTALLYDCKQELSWIEPEILHLPQEKITDYLESPLLKEYRTHLEKIVRSKPHTLGEKEEELLALSSKAVQGPRKTFNALNYADLKFPNIEDSQGRSLELTQGKYGLYLRDADRKLREEAFKTLHRGYAAFENTISETLSGAIQTHVFEARARKFSSCLEAALFPHQIDPEVYHALIRTVRKHLPVLHRYLDLRKRLLNVSELHLYDLYVPLVADIDLHTDYSQAEQLTIDAMAPLGEEYQALLSQGLKEGRWVDRYENARKRTGAYSSGCYDSMPYILMNYQGTLSDVMTLTHEAGHSMHTLFSCKHQPYQYSQYPIFVAEVASTFHENLLMRYLINQEKDEEKVCYLINQKLEGIRTTLFRQTMFAEFELAVHEYAEKGVPLTPHLFKETYLKLNRDYFGPNVVIDEEIAWEWSRIPHFYSDFYVYQYATGISAAHALSDLVITGGKAAREKYLTFLSSGSSRYPIDLLQLAGVDMKTGEAIESTIRHFDELISLLEVKKNCAKRDMSVCTELKYS